MLPRSKSYPFSEDVVQTKQMQQQQQQQQQSKQLPYQRLRFGHRYIQKLILFLTIVSLCLTVTMFRSFLTSDGFITASNVPVVTRLDPPVESARKQQTTTTNSLSKSQRARNQRVRKDLVDKNRSFNTARATQQPRRNVTSQADTRQPNMGMAASSSDMLQPEMQLLLDYNSDSSFVDFGHNISAKKQVHSRIEGNNRFVPLRENEEGRQLLLPNLQKLDVKLTNGKVTISSSSNQIASTYQLANHTSVITRRKAGNVSSSSQSPIETKTPFRFNRSMPDEPEILRLLPINRDPLLNRTGVESLKPLNVTRRTKYLGVLLDAGRHYFSMHWIKTMILLLSKLNYNILHFRLTDDQAFNVKLKSQPKLAYPSQTSSNDRKAATMAVYTPEELRDLVAYAKSLNITIIPEINVPGHAGSWAGIPGLIVQCPKFICEKGYGVPLNVTHPNLRPVLTDVLREVVDIFDNPPFLHLGGDEVEMAKPCFDEIGQPFPNYTAFEVMLKDILKEINYPENQVLRWEMTGQDQSFRAGDMTQFWFDVPGERKNSSGPFFASSGLYFDTNEDDMAWRIFLNTRQYFHLNFNYFPMGIVAGTFELSAHFWYLRNIIGRVD